MLRKSHESEGRRNRYKWKLNQSKRDAMEPHVVFQFYYRPRGKQRLIYAIDSMNADHLYFQKKFFSNLGRCRALKKENGCAKATLTLFDIPLPRRPSRGRRIGLQMNTTSLMKTNPVSLRVHILVMTRDSHPARSYKRSVEPLLRKFGVSL